jgi:MFS transporter, FHS family, L-fucose permease
MQRSRYLVGRILLIFFVTSLLTNVLGAIIPDIIESFGLSLTAAALLPFAFFIAYGVISIPSGMLVEACGEKRGILVGFSAGFLGSLAFALFPHYRVAIGSLFVTGMGMATLQVAINPLLRVAGGEENYAFNSTFAQVVFGSASFLSPQIYSYLVQSLSHPATEHGLVLRTLARLVPAKLPWVSVYWVFAGAAAIMLVVVSASRFPEVKRTEEEQVGTWETHRKLLRNPVVLLFFVTIFAYVGSEQGTANWISKFLMTYHHCDPRTTGASAVSWFWGLLTAGCLLGMLLLKFFDSRKVLIVFSIATLLNLTVALFGPGVASKVAFPLMGLCASVMWPITFSLALNSVAEYHGSFSGILCTAICGGAIVPVIIGRIGDAVNLRVGMMFLYLTFGWILSVGFWAKPLITNKTIGS